MGESDAHLECTKCGVEKPMTPEYFYKRDSKLGFRRECKECHNKRSRGYSKEHYQNNKEYYSDKSKRHREENPEYYRQYGAEYRKENKERIANYHVIYYLENRKEIAEYHREYYQENKDAYAEYQRQWQRENPEKVVAITQRYNARKAELPHTLTENEWKYSLKYFKYSCAYCGDGECNLEQEHILPVSKGGGYVVENIIPACRSCNASKGNADLIDWYLIHEKFDENKLNHILDYVNKTEGED